MATDISKRFPGVLALDGASLRVKPGEVHALLGENGAGKSTLIKILFGIYQRDSGRIVVDGQEVRSMSPKTAYSLGMAMIPQERTLVPQMTVAENMFLGKETRRPWSLIDRRKLVLRAQEWSRKFGIDLDSAATVGSLGVGAQQLVELVRALICQARVIIMDEPTSGLTERESTQLFEIVRGLRKRSVSIVYITHRLEEVFKLADRVTVLRDGRTVVTSDTSETTTGELIQLMAGKAVSQDRTLSSSVQDEVLLEVADLSRAATLHDISFVVRKGEIVGLAGLLGSGRTELLRCIFGADRMDSGNIRMRGRLCHVRSPIDAITAGIGLLPENRRTEGLCLKMSASDNIALASPSQVFKFGVLMTGRKSSLARRVGGYVRLDPLSLPVECRYLSGGNQQKVLLARWLSRQCDVLMLDEPTSGVDVATKAEIHNLVRELAAAGKGILVASSDFPELLDLCHRILVLKDGRITMSVANRGLSESELLGCAAGHEMGEWQDVSHDN